jgi:hypothetical protein
MKLKISVGVDFGKLADEMPKLIDETLTAYAEDTEQGSKDKIDRGVRPKLADATKKKRRSQGNPSNKVLFDKGNLYKSIKGDKRGLTLLEYGWRHHKNEGQYTLKNSVTRPFIEPTKDGFKKILDNFYKKSKEKLKRKTPLVLET